MSGITGLGTPNVGLGESIFVVKADATGHELWKRKIGASYPDAPDAGWSVIQTQDSGYVICGSLGETIITPPNDATRFPYIIKLDKSGNTLWSRTVGQASLEATLTSVVELADGSLVAVGNIDGKLRSLIVKLNAQGDSLWVRHHRHVVGVDSWNLLYALSKTSDDGFIATGTMLPLPPDSSGPAPWRQDLWVLKLDSLGCAYPGCELAATGIGEEPLSGLQVYPNPFDEQVTVSAPAGTEAKLILYDLTGRMMYETRFQGTQTVSVSLPAGVYLYQVTDRTGHSAQGRLIRR
ncbi:MAG: T9SS type A sorting domain-containing protein [Bacteroidia bacterium]|nr:T9SS type A sorting domain-containing protein [Bacteroidia bacterium]